MFENKKLLMAIMVFLVISILIMPSLVEKSSANSSTNPVEKDFDPAIVTKDKIYKYTKGNLNMRTGPGVDYELVTVIPKDAEVEFIEHAEGWDKVSYGGNTGFCAAAYLYEKIDGEEGSIIIPNTSTNTENNIKVIEFMKEINGILLVNKDYALHKDYSPGENREAKSQLRTMIKAFREEIGKDISAFSGYRSYDQQEKLYNESLELEGEEYTQKYVAKAGHSEHQTGLAYDIGGSDQNHWAKPSFGETEEGIWLANNAHRFGFILRYPKGKEDITGYGYEPWHFRYVGVENATYIYENNLTLEEYLIKSS